MITNGKILHYLAVKNFSALLRRITSNNNGDYTHLEQKVSLKSIIMYVKLMIIVM